MNEMNVLSFDIGTKNLAMCQLQVSKTSFTIQKWFVESTVSEEINVNKTPVAD
jgi:hypothetical protein